MKNPGKDLLSLPGKYILLLLFAAASIGFGVGVVVGAEEAAEAAEAQRRRSTPSPFGVPAVSRRQLGTGTGACCIANATDMCVPHTNSTFCEGLGGYYAGDDSGCNDVIDLLIPFCDVGSCCNERAADECEEVSAIQCYDEGLLLGPTFSFFVPGGNCSDDTDTCLRGACCTPKFPVFFGGCVSNVYKGECVDVSGWNGTFLGNGTECGGEEDICGCQEGNQDICGALDLPCGQECNYDFQCDSECCFTREQLKFRKLNDPRCPSEDQGEPDGDDCNVTNVTCSYDWDCDCCGECKYDTECTCQNGEWDCPDSTICFVSECPQPVGQCTESEWCECADQVLGEGGLLRDFLHCVKECTI